MKKLNCQKSLKCSDCISSTTPTQKESVVAYMRSSFGAFIADRENHQRLPAIFMQRKIIPRITRIVINMEQHLFEILASLPEISSIISYFIRFVNTKYEDRV